MKRVDVSTCPQTCRFHSRSARVSLRTHTIADDSREKSLFFMNHSRYSIVAHGNHLMTSEYSRWLIRHRYSTSTSDLIPWTLLANKDKPRSKHRDRVWLRVRQSLHEDIQETVVRVLWAENYRVQENTHVLSVSVNLCLYDRIPRRWILWGSELRLGTCSRSATSLHKFGVQPKISLTTWFWNRWLHQSLRIPVR